MRILSGFILILIFFNAASIKASNELDSLRKIIRFEKDEIKVAIALTILGDRIFFTYPDSALVYLELSEYKMQKILNTPSIHDTIKRKLFYYMAANYGDRGSIFLQKGDVPEAFSYYNMAMKINEKYQNTYGIASNLSNIGYIYQSRLNDNKRAIECYTKVLLLADKLGASFRWLKGNTLSSIAETYRESGNISLAVYYNDISYTINKQERNLTGLANALNIRAKILNDQNRISKAIQAAEESNTLYLQSGDLEGYSGNLILLGNLLISRNELPKAENALKEAIEVSTRNNYRINVKEASEALKQIYFRQKRWKEAADMSELHGNITDSIENKSMLTKTIRDLINFENKNRALEDSLRFMSEQLKKDKQIQRQEIQIKQQKLMRNTAIGGTLVLLAAVLILFFRYRLIQKQKENQLQINALETEQKLLRAQMNPHFINNSLNSIQGLILENESIEAGEYLATFSRLTRAILDQTNRKTIPLSKEIETLILYLEMEELRFDNKFKYRIDLTNDMHPESIFIPPLLIQPFVENSILHGIMPKAGTGEIIVDFKVTGKKLNCTITDNGIGRDKAREINSQKLRQSSSMATDLAKNRLRLLNNNADNAITIKDLKSFNGMASGTSVNLIIPITNP